MLNHFDRMFLSEVRRSMRERGYKNKSITPVVRKVKHILRQNRWEAYQKGALHWIQMFAAS